MVVGQKMYPSECDHNACSICVGGKKEADKRCTTIDTETVDKKDPWKNIINQETMEFPSSCGDRHPENYGK